MESELMAQVGFMEDKNLDYILPTASICRVASNGQAPLVGKAPGTADTTAEDSAGCLSSEGSLEPMTTGNEFLDRALVLHLNHCNRLLLKLGNFGPLRCQEMYALDRLGRDVQVLEMASRLIVDRAGMASSAEEVVQFSKWKEGVFSFWDRGVAAPNVYTCCLMWRMP
uniref:Uncharacterized protein n=1 Tax=Micrurus surinamensis TaxID=129470 RepID=A0A2D4NS56_MICSU